MRTAAETLGVPLEDIERAWAVLGLTVAGLATWVAYKALVGDEAALGAGAPGQILVAPAVRDALPNWPPLPRTR